MYKRQVFYDALTPSERDYTAILTKLKAADPDLIFFTGYYPCLLYTSRGKCVWASLFSRNVFPSFPNTVFFRRSCSGTAG